MKYILSILLICASTFQFEVEAKSLSASLVTQGAFLIYENENLVISGRKTRGLKTYLPLGTVAIIDTEVVSVRNHRSKLQESYNRVTTTTGATGLLRTDLRDDLPPGKWLIATSESEITILQTRKIEPRSSFSKRSGKYTRVLEIPTADNPYYKVSLPWAIHNDGKEDVGRIDATYVEDGSLVFIDTDNLPNTLSSIPIIEPLYTTEDMISESAKDYLGISYKWLIDRLSSKDGADIEKIKSYIQNVVLSPCDFEIKAEASLDLTFRGSGLRIEIPLSLKKKGHIYHIDAFEPKQFDSNLGKHFIVFRNITCKGSTPHRMNTIIIQGESMDGLDVNLGNLPVDLVGRWDSNFKSERFRTRMVVINGSEKYQKLFEYIEQQATEGTWLRSLKGNEMNAFIAYIISSIAHFEKP